jgi:hypothetical protein
MLSSEHVRIASVANHLFVFQYPAAAKMKVCEISLASTGRIWANYVTTQSRDP